MILFDILKIIFEKSWSVFSNRRVIRLTVHKALFTKPIQECFFVTVTNLSPNKEVEITHIWFDCNPKVFALNEHRLLPKRLKPDETWETWIETTEIPEDLHDTVYTLARVRLSNGKVINSIPNTEFPEMGLVPGGKINHDKPNSE